MRLYHGSKRGIEGPIRPISRSCCDFGRGFYMGSEPSQPMTLICREKSPKFYTCEFDMTGLRVHRFDPTVEWAMFVVWNRGLMPDEYRAYSDRRFRPIADGNDVIVGKIANDRMQWAGEQYVFEEVMEEAGLKADENCERYNTEALFYAGWIYRYWHYMTGESSKEIFRQADEDEILGSYGLHIEANELAVEDLKALAAQKKARSA